MKLKEEKTLYVFDANCFIEAWNRFYTPSIFKSYWDDMLLSRIESGSVVIQEEIFDEVIRKDTNLQKWIKEKNIVSVKTDIKITKKVQEINEKFVNLIKESKGKSLADPFIIAYASLHGGTVVTQETGGNDNKPKIPYVCRKMRVRCIDLFDFLKETDAKFVYSSVK